MAAMEEGGREEGCVGRVVGCFAFLAGSGWVDDHSIRSSRGPGAGVQGAGQGAGVPVPPEAPGCVPRPAPARRRADLAPCSSPYRPERDHRGEGRSGPSSAGWRFWAAFGGRGGAISGRGVNREALERPRRPARRFLLFFPLLLGFAPREPRSARLRGTREAPRGPPTGPWANLERATAFRANCPPPAPTPCILSWLRRHDKARALKRKHVKLEGPGVGPRRENGVGPAFHPPLTAKPRASSPLSHPLRRPPPTGSSPRPGFPVWETAERPFTSPTPNKRNTNTPPRGGAGALPPLSRRGAPPSDGGSCRLPGPAARSRRAAARPRAPSAGPPRARPAAVATPGGGAPGGAAGPRRTGSRWRRRRPRPLPRGWG